MRTLLPVIVLLLAAGPRGVHAQADAVPSPLLLTTMPPPAHARVVAALDLGYSERAFEPVAGERLEPNRPRPRAFFWSTLTPSAGMRSI
jgi:hypothetical protein